MASSVGRWRRGWLIPVLLILVFLWPSPVSAGQRIHVVRVGDNLTRIAAHYGVSVNDIVRTNGIRNPNLIWAGQRLRIPTENGTTTEDDSEPVVAAQSLQPVTPHAPGAGTPLDGEVESLAQNEPNSAVSSGETVHVVRRGEILSRIAARHGTTVAAIARVNGLRNPNFIWAGQRLRIPSGQAITPAPVSTSTSTISSGKWIEVDLGEQTTMAWEGARLMRRMVVSTGLPYTPTPIGRYRIQRKYPSVPMSGPGYYLPGVPHSMFFYKGYAIHGTYWHNNFGHPMSHGCVNLTRADAAWLYSWAPVGTPVVIHW